MNKSNLKKYFLVITNSLLISFDLLIGYLSFVNAFPAQLVTAGSKN